MENLSYKRMVVFQLVLFFVVGASMLVSCVSSVKVPRKYENRIITHKVDRPPKPYPKDIKQLRAKVEPQIPRKEKFRFVSAKRGIEVYKKYPGAEQVIKSLKPASQAVVSSSSALESLIPAMWWGVKSCGGGGVYPEATVVTYPGDFWNIDVVTNCSNFFAEPSMTQIPPERVCFSAADDTNDLYYGSVAPPFAVGGPNGVMQFMFAFGTPDTETFLGVLTMYGDSENVELYVDETLVTTYNVTWQNQEYSFLVDLSAGAHYVTVIHRSTSSSRLGAQLYYEQFLLYRI